MPEFKRNPSKFFCRGMNWNRPIDALPDGQYALLINVRSYVDGQIESRPGLSMLSNEIPPTSDDYIHSGYTLNDDNPDTGGGSLRFIGIRADRGGMGVLTGELWTASIFNPIPLGDCNLTDDGYSGNPLSMVPFLTDASMAPFLYVGDSLKMRKYSDTFVSAGIVAPVFTPTPYPIGLPHPSFGNVLNIPAPVITIVGGAVTGIGYYWRWRLRHSLTGVKSGPGPVTYTAVDLSADSVTVPTPVTAYSTDYYWDLFRFGGTVLEWRYVGSAVDGGVTITDNLTDAQIRTAELLNVESVDFPGTESYQPFVTVDVDRAGACSTIAATATEGSLVTSSVGAFNVNWIPGTEILINGVRYSIRRFVSTTQLYINEDAGVIGGPVVWQVAGGLQEGTPLPHLWGPYGVGIGGLVLFACGDPHSPGTLYWTFGNDPDSTRLTYSLDITSPSEPLQNGCIYNGRAYVWSTERMFEISPGGLEGQFIAQVIVGNRGMDTEWCMTVGDYMYYKSKDGIYRCSGGPAESITDEALRRFFPHDGQPGDTVQIPNPEAVFPDGPFETPFLFNPPDPILTNTHRLSFGDGMLYFDYAEDAIGAANRLSDTLVYDTRTKGWSLDEYGGSRANRLGGRVSRWWEESHHSLLVGIGNILYHLTGVSDHNLNVASAIMTKADVLGDMRSLKLIGDAVIGATQAVGITATLLGFNNTGMLPSATGPVSAAGSYTQTVLSVNGGVGTLSRTVGLWLYWDNQLQTKVDDWEPSFVPKPEFTDWRATDWTNDGTPAPKWLKGCVIEANTLNVAKSILLQAQDTNGALVTLATFAITHNGQTEIPYAFTPQVVRQMRIIPQDADSWSLFSVRWLWEPYPEYLNLLEDYSLDRWPAPKHVRGLALEGDTLGANVAFQAVYDGGASIAIPGLVQSGRTLTTIAFAVPFIASEIKLVPLAAWRKFSVRWIFDEYPDFGAIITPWEVSMRPRHIRGLNLRADTNNLILGSVGIQGDGGAPVAALASVQHNGQEVKHYNFATPFVTYSTRLLPSSNWRFFEAAWDFETYPDLVIEPSAWIDAGTVSAKHMRGMRLTADTGGLPVIFLVEYDGGFYATPATTFSGKTTIPFAFPTPFVCHNLRIKPMSAARVFLSETEWIFDLYPELAAIYSAWIDAGTPAAKYMQGIRLTADTNGAAVLFIIAYDGGNYALPATSFPGKTTIPFSFSIPFIAHNLRIIPVGAARIWMDETEWVFEPVPELALTWQTQPTNHNIPGYHSLRDTTVAYQSAPGAVIPETLTVTTEYGSLVYSLPVAPVFARRYVILNPQKAKWRTYRIDSTLGVRVFIRDTIVRAKGWGEPGPYRNYMTSFSAEGPIGDLSRTAGARI